VEQKEDTELQENLPAENKIILFRVLFIRKIYFCLF